MFLLLLIINYDSLCHSCHKRKNKPYFGDNNVRDNSNEETCVNYAERDIASLCTALTAFPGPLMGQTGVIHA